MITLENITKTYQMGATQVHALRGLSLQIERGEFVVVLGPSGSGKSTLLNIVSALDVPSSGKIVVNGKDISQTNRSERFAFRRETISFIFQSFNLFPSLTALENVQFVMDMYAHQNGRQSAQENLENVSLGRRANHFTHELSGGEQQRVAIARALATGNPVLLADEPTGALDFQTGVEIIQLLKAQAARGKTVILVTHNREISRVADRVIEISSGQIVRDSIQEKLPISELHW